jgi:drug/metabolite transporter (DMT)-like permease
MTAIAAAHSIPLTRPWLLRTQHTGILSCAAAMAILGASVPVTQTLTGFPHMAGQGVRYGLAAAVLVPLAARARWQRPPIRVADWVRLGVIATCSLVGYNLLLLTALSQGDPAVIATILGCAPIVLGLATPLLSRQPPSIRVLCAAAIVVVGTTILNGSGHLDSTGFACALGTLVADLIFTLAAAPMLTRLGPITVAAATCTLAVPMFAVLAAATGEIRTWRTPTIQEAHAIAFLGVILTAVCFVLWFTGLRNAGTSKAGTTIGIIPVAALTVASIHTGTTPTPAQATAVAVVAAGLMLATTTWTPRLHTIHIRLRPALVGLTLLALAAGCRANPASAPAQEDPAQPVREYFAALARGDAATAYLLSRSSSRWLSGDGLARGYEPPANLTIIAITFAPQGNGQLAYVRAQYQLAGAPYESTFEVWNNATGPPHWAISNGATGRLDVISASTPHVKVANVEVVTQLSGPRISGGTPSAGYFEVPPGVYTITVASDRAQSAEEVHVAVPAMWRDNTPITATIRGSPEHQ